MSRRIASAILLFALVVLCLAAGTAYAIVADHQRQARQSAGRFFGHMLEQGETFLEVKELAAQEGYSIRLVSGELRVEGSFSRGANWPARYLMIAMVAGSAAFALLLARQVARPIRALTEVSMQITAGDYSRRVPERSRAELRRLEQAFNAMAAQLQETIQKLNNSSAEMEIIIAAMRHGFIAVDEQMHVIRLNPPAREMFEVYGNPHGKYILEVTRNANLENHLTAAMEQGEMYTADMPVRVGRENRTLRLYVTPLVQDSSPIGALALIEDITQMQRLQNVRADFVANVTHELKTPLTSIRGFVETLQQGTLEDREASMRFLSIIAMETERLTRLIDDVLGLSSLESGRSREKIKPLAMSSYAQLVCEILNASAMEKNTALRLEDESAGARVMAGEDKVKQMLINLIDNAIKYTPEGGNVLVRLTAREGHLVLEVKDDGIGIEAAHMPRLFERFYRVDKGRSRSMGGTGLGLAIVKHIVLEMGGDIQVDSEPGNGTVFTVTLPVVEEETA